MRPNCCISNQNSFEMGVIKIPFKRRYQRRVRFINDKTAVRMLPAKPYCAEPQIAATVNNHRSRRASSKRVLSFQENVTELRNHLGQAGMFEFTPGQFHMSISGT